VKTSRVLLKHPHDFGNRSGMHLVDYACTMQELYDNAGMTETWWHNSFWWPLMYSSEATIESSETHKSKMHIYMCVHMKILLP
jgi:hypothetical protein